MIPDSLVRSVPNVDTLTKGIGMVVLTVVVVVDSRYMLTSMLLET
ncbi:hypothetical protein J2750_002195 [Methanococcoides alaskense]|uniref:Uncharacterized protein n=1 Tax=Methanococcoides alaskense TaxID=325778 RepID=A0AA90U1Y9_9EURY|nr:hypothetical protein [Methanococcoides alaskense]